MYKIRLKDFNFKKNLIIFSFFSIPYITVLGYYLYIMTGAPELGGVESLTPNWKASIIQITYYFAGFGGLGLSRNDLRSMAFSNLSWEHLTGMALLAVSYSVLIFYFIKNKLWRNNQITSIALSIVITFVVFCVANIVFKTRFWERHIIYLLPTYILLLCCILKPMVSSPNKIYKAGAIFMVGLMMISGIRTMCDQYYEKEDYKGVATYIKNTKDVTFFLQGDSLIYDYYKVNLEDHSQFRMINNVSKEDLDEIISKNSGASSLILSSREEFDAGQLYQSISPRSGEITYNSFRIIRDHKEP